MIYHLTRYQGFLRTWLHSFLLSVNVPVIIRYLEVTDDTQPLINVVGKVDMPRTCDM